MGKKCPYSRRYLASWRAQDIVDLLKPVPLVRKSALAIHWVKYAPKKQFIARSLGLDYVGAAVPVNDNQDQYSLARGVCRRLLLKTPEIDVRLMREFRTFVRRYLRVISRRYGLVPLDAVKSFDEWVDNINHPEWRKQELREAKLRVDQGVPPRDLFVNKFHGKIEHLEGAKENRGINARCDEAKVLFGPAISSIEDAVYRRIPEFAKHVPVCQLPKRIEEECAALGTDTIIATDYTSFEGHFSPMLIRSCEGQLYHHMLKHVAPDLATTLVRVLSGVNRCESRRLTFSVQGCRMSGDMMTSLGNGFTNLMIIKFLGAKLGFTFRGFVEGDDGLFVIHGPVPDPSWYQRLGFTVKMDVHKKPHVASFCGQVYDPDTCELVVDPIYTCLTVGWTLADQRHGGPMVLKSLLRAKGISLAYQAPRCPVVGALARMILRLTTGVEHKFETFHGVRDWWQTRLLGDNVSLSDDIASRLSIGPSIGAREVCERVYGVSVEDQVELERYFDGMTTIRPWSHSVIDKSINPVYRRYYELCVQDFSAGELVSSVHDAEFDWADVADVRGRSYRKMPRIPFDEEAAQAILDPSTLHARWYRAM